MLEARDLVVIRGGQRILHVPSLHLRRGEVLSIIGPNGSGKSTLLLTLALLLRPNHGEIIFYGKPVGPGGSGAMVYRRRTATVFQEPLLLNTSVERNVATGLRLRGMPGPEVKARVTEWLGRFGIAHLARRSARALSGGEAQRTSLARAFVLCPEILFLDEPFSSLDAPAKAAILDDVKRVIQETGVTAVFVTHDRDEALSLGDRIGVLMQGEIRQVDSATNVMQSPLSEEIAAFIGVDTVVPGVVSNCEEGLTRIDVGGHVIEAVGDCSISQRVLVCLRPEDITVSMVGENRITSARNRLSGVILKLSPHGPMLKVKVDCGFPLVAAVTRQSATDLGLEVGRSVSVSFKASAIHLIRK